MTGIVAGHRRMISSIDKSGWNIAASGLV